MTETEWKLTREIMLLKRQIIAVDMERLKLASHIVEGELAAHGENYTELAKE